VAGILPSATWLIPVVGAAELEDQVLDHVWALVVMDVVVATLEDDDDELFVVEL